jgi:hypothetical protein
MSIPKKKKEIGYPLYSSCVHIIVGKIWWMLLFFFSVVQPVGAIPRNLDLIVFCGIEN